MTISTMIEDIYPLAPIQQGMLFHHLYAPESRIDFTQYIYIIEGRLDTLQWWQSWRITMERNQILRTSFYWEELEEPLQVVHRSVQLVFAEQNWIKVSDHEQKERLEAYLNADNQQGMVLTEAPLFRLALFKLTEKRFQFVLTCHHIIMEDWSRNLIFDEVITIYEALVQSETISLSQRRPYREYITWLQRQDTHIAQLYWQQKLRGFHAPTSLRIERNLAKKEDGYDALARHRVILPQETFAKLSRWARLQQITFSTLILGAWALLLQRYSGEKDVVFGVVVLGRPPWLEEVEQIVGVFINTIPLRVHMDAEELLSSWLHNLQLQQVETQQFEYSSLAQIQRWSEVPPDLAVFDTAVAIMNFTNQHRGKDISVQLSDVNSQVNYPITLTGVLEDSGLLFELSYSSSRFDKSAIKRMSEHLNTLLESISFADSRKKLCELPILPEWERQKLLIDWNRTNIELSRSYCLHELFAAQAERTPEALALIYGNEQISYRELDERSNQLAHYLRHLGVGVESRIAIYMKRSVDMVISLLAVLKAGSTYVPLDPAYPLARITMILEDARPTVLLTDASIAPIIPDTNATIICLDNEQWTSLGHNAVTMPQTIVTSRNLAYILFTSGSTGRPKGVAIEHRSVVSLIQWAQQVFSSSDLAGVLASTSICFDLSVFELFVPLSCGGTVILLENILSLLDYHHSHKVTLINTVPTAMMTLLQLGGIPRTVRTINLAGELLSTALVKQIHQQTDARQVFDLYGPSETTTYATASIRHDNGPMTIGRPIANTHIYVLDSFGQPVPIGVPGELYIGGLGVARGYHLRPDLTAAAFLPDPFGLPGARMYKTGDLARYSEDGQIEFLGRGDRQEKVRGFRVELDEIEIVLQQFPAIQTAVVMVNTSESGDKYLVAYLVPDHLPPYRLQVTQIQDFLKTQLPDYMIPSIYQILETLPLTPSGKIDRRSLFAPAGLPTVQQTTYVAPRTAIESFVARVWGQVLDVKHLGIHDNVFSLGAHSLLAVQVLLRLRNVFPLELSLRNIFEFTTIADLACYIEICAQALHVNVERIAQLHLQVGQLSEEEVRSNLEKLNNTREEF